MGQTPSKPKPGVKLQVVVAGLPRTGTASISEALKILLQAPVYHGGTQVTMSEEKEIKSWIEILEHCPIRSPADEQIVINGLENRYEGFAAVSDAPGHMFVGELLRLYPKAKVICTIRDKEPWVKSMAAVTAQAKMTLLSWILWPVPTMRYFSRYIDILENGRWAELFYFDKTTRYDWARIWDRHIAYVEREVPPDQLLLYDVREGWAPLCKFLELPIPKDVEFPRVNDGKAMEAFAAKQVLRGLKAWAGILAGGALVVATAVNVWRRR